MLDFVLNLLIFFIITAAVAREMSLALNRPINVVDDAGRPAIPISITAGGEVYVDNRAVDLRAVRPSIEGLCAENPKLSVLIVTDARAETGILTQVVDAVRLGGIYDITFATAN